MGHSPDPNRQGSLFSAKTSRPKLPKILPREECLKQLEDAKDHKIVYISGFAGLGKTTLALSYLKQSRAKSVWVTLDENDNEPTAFFQLMAEAIAVAFPKNPLNPPSIPTSGPRCLCEALFQEPFLTDLRPV